MGAGLQDTQADPAEIEALREQVGALEQQLAHAVQVYTFLLTARGWVQHGAELPHVWLPCLHARPGISR